MLRYSLWLVGVLLMLPSTTRAQGRILLLGLRSGQGIDKGASAAAHRRLTRMGEPVLPRGKEDASCSIDEVDCIRGLAQRTGAQFVIYGDMTRVDRGHRIRMRLFDARQQQVEGKADGTCEGCDAASLEQKVAYLTGSLFDEKSAHQPERQVAARAENGMLTRTTSAPAALVPGLGIEGPSETTRPGLGRRIWGGALLGVSVPLLLGSLVAVGLKAGGHDLCTDHEATSFCVPSQYAYGIFLPITAVSVIGVIGGSYLVAHPERGNRP